MAAIGDGDAVFAVLLAGWSTAATHRRLQFSRDGRWEEAHGVEMPTDADTARSLLRETGDVRAHVAAEVEWLGHRLAFVGARRGADDDAAFADAVARIADREPFAPRVALEALAGGPPVRPEHAELGAANAWKSVGPLRLWDGEDALPSRDVDELLRDRLDLARCVAPVALEITFAGPRQCWVGIEVSVPSADGHVVQAEALKRLLGGLFAPPAGRPGP